MLGYDAYARVTVQGVTFAVSQVQFMENSTRLRLSIRNQSGAYFDFNERSDYVQLISSVGRMSLLTADRALWGNEKWGALQPPNTTVEGALVFPPMAPQEFKLVLQGKLGNDDNLVRAAIVVDLPMQRPKF